MSLSRRSLLGTTAAAATAFGAARSGRAQAANTIKIGVLNDQSGPYRDTGGVTSVACTKLAVAEFAAKGFNVEVVAADHQNKPDVGAEIARQWYDRDGVDMIIDVPTSSVALAVAGVAKEKNKLHINVGAATSDLTGKSCAPSLIHWCYDTYMLAKSTGGATVKAGGDSWFFVTADYAFGQQLQKDTTAFVTAAGGKVMGSVAYPFPGTTDFSSYVLQAQASKADVVVFANGGDDAVNGMKAAREFGLVEGGQKIVPLGLDALPAIKSASLEVAQGAMFVTPWLPTLSPEAADFMKKFIARRKVAPSTFQVGTYSAVRAYLQAVKDTNSTDPKTVIAKMQATHVKDAFTNDGTLRPDGRMVHDVYVVQIKKPSESQGEWDLLKSIATIPGEKAFRPISEGGCPEFTAK